MCRRSIDKSQCKSHIYLHFAETSFHWSAQQRLHIKQCLHVSFRGALYSNEFIHTQLLISIVPMKQAFFKARLFASFCSLSETTTAICSALC